MSLCTLFFGSNMFFGGDISFVIPYWLKQVSVSLSVDLFGLCSSCKHPTVYHIVCYSIPVVESQIWWFECSPAIEVLQFCMRKLNSVKLLKPNLTSLIAGQREISRLVNLLSEQSNSTSLVVWDRSKDVMAFHLHFNFSKSERTDTSSSGNLLFEHSNSFSLGFLDKSKDTSSFPSHTNFSKAGRTDTSSLVSPLYEQSRSFSLEFWINPKAFPHL